MGENTGWVMYYANEALPKAYRLGIEAYILGLSIAANPYDEKCQNGLYNEWIKGYSS